MPKIVERENPPPCERPLGGSAASGAGWTPLADPYKYMDIMEEVDMEERVAEGSGK